MTTPANQFIASPCHLGVGDLPCSSVIAPCSIAQANRWRQLSNGRGQDVRKVGYIKALVCNECRNSDCRSNLGVVRRMLLNIQPQSLICRMEINKVGKLKNPGDARPFAFQMLK